MTRRESTLLLLLLLAALAASLQDCRQCSDAPPWRGDVVTQGRRER